MTEFAQRYPRRFFDVGIAEGHAVTMASGLAKQGMLPVVAIVGALNGMITFLLFGPVRKLFFVQEDDE